MNELSIKVLGELTLFRGDRRLVLPPSRKARALLGYLVLTARPHRRERLCELFWDLPDDPRGALRWALSKLRPLIDVPDAPLIQADRERVSIIVNPGAIDLLRAKALLSDPANAPAIKDLRAMAELLSDPVLDGIDLAQAEAFHTWLVGLRAETTSLWHSCIERLLRHPEHQDHDVLHWARAWLQSDPLALPAVKSLIRVCRKLGRHAEADGFANDYRATALQSGVFPIPDPEASDDTREGHDLRAANDPQPHATLRQTIGFCRAADGARIAYAEVGEGQPIVKAANWLNHLELDWDSPIWGRTFAALAAHNRLIRYDERGNGLSDWDVADISQAAFVRDLETVVDALNLRRFPLIGMSQGCAVGIEYAVRHPGRVSALILIGGYAAGWRIAATPEEIERREAVMTLTRLGWGTSNSAYRRIFSQTFMPDGTPEDLAYFDELQRLTTSADNAVRFQDAFGDIDVRHLLPQVRVPTLVMHSRDDQRIRLDQGRDLATSIPNARFVTLESRNHILLGHEPAWGVAMLEIERFLGSVKDG
jgi:pimeloyl-ACP methyl ester carboxylesterase/DNA-binding SARP family transcriptional activator